MMLFLLLLLQIDPAEEYAKRAAALKDSDADGHCKLGAWCEEKKLAEQAKREFEKAIAANPNHEGARGKLGHKKIHDVWVPKEIREAAAKGVRFPGEEETRKMRAKGKYYGKVIDIFWDTDNWAVALARIQERTGLFEGVLDVEVRFGDLGKIPAAGEGVGGKGFVVIDMKNLSKYEETIEEFLKRVAGGGVAAVPPAKTPAIITHELAHCFQGMSQPWWFLEGMATWCAGDGHFVYYFRYFKEKVQDIEVGVEHKYIYGRGWAFFEYGDAKFGREKMKELMKLCIRDKKDVSVAAPQLFGKDWAALKKEERDWAAKWISNFKSRYP